MPRKKAPRARRLSEHLTLAIDLETLRSLRSQARESGVSPSELVRTFIQEGLEGLGIQALAEQIDRTPPAAWAKLTALSRLLDGLS